MLGCGPLEEWSEWAFQNKARFSSGENAEALRENRFPSCRLSICCECTMLYDSALFTNEVMPTAHAHRALQKHTMLTFPN